MYANKVRDKEAEKMSYVWYQKGERLLREVENFRLPEQYAGIWYIGQMGVILKWKEMTVYIDPVLGPMNGADGRDQRNYPIPFSPKDGHADYVFCTHDHADHMHLETLSAMAKVNRELKIFVPLPVVEQAKAAGIPESNLCGLRQDENLQLKNGCCVRPVATAHEEYCYDADGSSMTLGYVFGMGKLKLFHAGDTVVTHELIGELQKEQGLDAALVPINGRDIQRNARGIIGNMDSREAVWFGEAVQADLLIPLHYDMIGGNEENPLVFADYMERYRPEGRYHILRLGEGYVLMKNEKNRKTETTAAE